MASPDTFCCADPSSATPPRPLGHTPGTLRTTVANGAEAAVHRATGRQTCGRHLRPVSALLETCLKRAARSAPSADHKLRRGAGAGDACGAHATLRTTPMSRECGRPAKPPRLPAAPATETASGLRLEHAVPRSPPQQLGARPPQGTGRADRGRDPPPALRSRGDLRGRRGRAGPSARRRRCW